MKTILQDVQMKHGSIRAIILQRGFLNSRFIFVHDDPEFKKEI
jgi:hypothetical protein